MVSMLIMTAINSGLQSNVCSSETWWYQVSRYRKAYIQLNKKSYFCHPDISSRMQRGQWSLLVSVSHHIINRNYKTWEILFVGEKLKFLFKEFHFIKSLKIWWSMADMPCSTKFSMTLYYLLCFYISLDMLPQQLRNYQMFYLTPWQNVVSMTSLYALVVKLYACSECGFWHVRNT